MAREIGQQLGASGGSAAPEPADPPWRGGQALPLPHFGGQNRCCLEIFVLDQLDVCATWRKGIEIIGDEGGRDWSPTASRRAPMALCARTPARYRREHRRWNVEAFIDDRHRGVEDRPGDGQAPAFPNLRAMIRSGSVSRELEPIEMAAFATAPGAGDRPRRRAKSTGAILRYRIGLAVRRKPAKVTRRRLS